jgi:hypothetical protein
MVEVNGSLQHDVVSMELACPTLDCRLTGYLSLCSFSNLDTYASAACSQANMSALSTPS